MTVNPGEVYYNPRCREKIVIRTPAADTGGERTVMDLYVEPGGFAAGYHTHPYSDERFTLVRGKLKVHMDGRELILDEPGQSVLIEPGTVHRWFSATDDEETFAICELRNKAEKFENLLLRQLFGLAQDGKTNAEGIPTLLQRAVTSLEFSDVLRFTNPPWRVQRVIYGALAPLAKLLGHQGFNPAYLHRRPSESAALEELPPDVLALHPPADAARAH